MTSPKPKGTLTLKSPASIGVFGLNHKSSRLELRESIQRHLGSLENACARFRDHSCCEEVLLLSTCNRIEVYFTSRHFEKTVREIEKMLRRGLRISLTEFRNNYYLFRGEDAVRHCFAVAPGLDSMILGEPEILGQMKKAFQSARDQGALHGVLLHLFEKTFQAAKEIRSHTAIGKGSIGTASVSIALAQKVCGTLQEKSILVLGGGQLGKKLLSHFTQNGCRSITVCSRRSDRSQELARLFSVREIPFSSWRDQLQQTDLLVAATSQPKTLLSYQELSWIMKKRKHQPLCLIDLAVPRTIDPKASRIANVHLYNIEDLKGIGYQNLKFRENAMAQAYAILHARTKVFLMELRSPNWAPVLPKVRQMVRECIRQESEALLKLQRPSFCGQNNEETMTRLEKRLTHTLLTQLKSLREDGGESLTGNSFSGPFREATPAKAIPDSLKHFPGDFWKAVQKRFHEELPSLMAAG